MFKKIGETEVTTYDETYKVNIMLGKYQNNGRPAIQLVESDPPYEPVATLSVNIVEEPLIDGHIHIKSWSENEEVANHFRDSEWFEDTGVRVICGFCQAEVWKLKII